jgi:hypothetical protein
MLPAHEAKNTTRVQIPVILINFISKGIYIKNSEMSNNNNKYQPSLKNNHARISNLTAEIIPTQAFLIMNPVPFCLTLIGKFKARQRQSDVIG